MEKPEIRKQKTEVRLKEPEIGDPENCFEPDRSIPVFEMPSVLQLIHGNPHRFGKFYQGGGTGVGDAHKYINKIARDFMKRGVAALFVSECVIRV